MSALRIPSFSSSAPGRRALALLLALFGLVLPVSADDCDNWGRVVHAGRRSGDNLCTLRAGPDGGVTKRLEDAYDFDYFVFFLGYDDETPINQRYTVTLETRLSRPKFTVSTFYDETALRLSGQSYEQAQKLHEYWYARHGTSLGIDGTGFRNMVTLGPNLQHDGVYDYVDGQVVVVQESSDVATRRMFYAVPVGSSLGANTEGENMLSFTPPDKGAYVVVVSNYSPTRRSGRRTGSYKVSVNRE